MNPIKLKLQQDGPLTTGYRFERDGAKVDDIDALCEGFQVEGQAAHIVFATIQSFVLQHRLAQRERSHSE